MSYIDVTLPISPESIVWPGDPAVTVEKVAAIAAGDICTVTRLALGAHTGTHLDAPAHFLGDGAGVETLDLHVLIGPALVIKLCGVPEITAELLEAAGIPPDTTRLLLKTDNSNRWAAGETTFAEDFVALTDDGAAWCVENGIRLVGIDYLSIAPFTAPIECHQTLLRAGIIPVEGLNLHHVDPGEYQLICLPLLIPGSDGAPVRAVLQSL
jgi:arylformamidase